MVCSWAIILRSCALHLPFVSSLLPIRFPIISGVIVLCSPSWGLVVWLLASHRLVYLRDHVPQP